MNFNHSIKSVLNRFEDSQTVKKCTLEGYVGLSLFYQGFDKVISELEIKIKEDDKCIQKGNEFLDSIINRSS